MAVILAVGVSLVTMGRSGVGSGNTVVVRCVGGEDMVLDLHRAQRIEVKGLLGTTTISIEDGAVCFLDSPCPHRLCVKKGRVSLVGDLIACLPNGVVARIVGESDYDGITP